ncbi:MAG: ABC transporter ATP-binding protein [Acidobacteriota bacterium]
MSGPRPETDGPALVEVRHLVHRYPIGHGWLGGPRGYLNAVDDVSLRVWRGETLGLVGETGSGKSTLGRCLVRLIKPTSGEILFEGEDLLALRGGALRRKRRDFQIIFQDPYGSLNPRMRVEAIVTEPLAIHRMGDRRQRRERAVELLDQVGMEPSALPRFPHEFSGGQRQRIGIARALALNPKFVVCDEPVSALDVSVQAQIINLLQDLQERLGLTYLFIAHGLQVVAHISTRVAVLFQGRIVEMGPREELFQRPLHPYTRSLLDAVLDPDPGVPRPAREGPQAEPAAVHSPAPGCRFAPRCPLAEQLCRAEEPALRELAPGHTAACHLADSPAAGH